MLVELCRSGRPEVAAEALELLGLLEPEAPEFQRELARMEASDADFRIQQAIREIRAESANPRGRM